jgi:transposase
MAKGRRRYDKEFKEQAVKMVLEQCLTATEVARMIEVDRSSVAAWVRAYEKDGPDAFPGKGKSIPPDEEIRRLKEENLRLKQERDFLKKTAVFFAKDQ